MILFFIALLCFWLFFYLHFVIIIHLLITPPQNGFHSGVIIRDDGSYGVFEVMRGLSYHLEDGLSLHRLWGTIKVSGVLMILNFPLLFVGTGALCTSLAEATMIKIFVLISPMRKPCPEMLLYLWPLERLFQPISYDHVSSISFDIVSPFFHLSNNSSLTVNLISSSNFPFIEGKIKKVQHYFTRWIPSIHLHQTQRKLYVNYKWCTRIFSFFWSYFPSQNLISLAYISGNSMWLELQSWL